MNTLKLPDNICDCHVHVFEAPNLYPFSSQRTYTPGIASFEQLQSLHRSLGVKRTVIVQASPYGSDNTCLLDSLDRLDGSGRGVVVVSEDTSKPALKEMHARGVRGVRVNLETAGNSDPVFAAQALNAAARKVADLGWHVQTYTNLGVLRELTETIQNLPTPLVVDHFGKADAALGVSQPGFLELCDLVRAGNVYVKLTAPYRVSKLDDYGDVRALARHLINAQPSAVVWGTDWPHPGAATGAIKRGIDEITPFRDENNLDALHRAMAWAENDSELEQLLSTNAGALYQF